ncbi:hypothetical protein P7C73_g1021, partial [Tremellales sp. Uapishka_1]
MPFLQSIQSFFNPAISSSADTRHAPRRSVMSHTFDAFSLPSSQSAGARFDVGMGGIPHGVPQADSASSSPGPSRRTSYVSYPPPKEYARQAPNYYPPLSHTFHRLRNCFVETFPELLETLNASADPALLASFEAELGCPLPPPVRESFLVADGQDLATGNSGGIFFGLHLLPLEEVMREWSFWRRVEQDPSAGKNAVVLATMASAPPAWIKSLYACRGWVPLLSDQAGNYVGVDLDPGPGGAWGQVIVFGRDFDRKCVLWKGEGEGGWGRWMASFVDELESGEGWEAEKSNSSDEEDDVGYGSYNGGQSYGEAGGGIKLAGEYRGWNVLEAWWDKSVRQWEKLGLGLDVEEVERGMSEARRLTGIEGKGKSKEEEMSGLGLGMRMGTGAAQVEIPVIGSPQIAQTHRGPQTPIPGDDSALLPPSSPDQPSVIPKIHHPTPSAVRIITPLATTSDHPLKPRDTGLLSPPSHSPPRQSRRRLSNPHIPIPATLDLPTRADVQASQAVAQAEQSGLRGGWVMSLDASLGAAARRTPRHSGEEEMVDIDLEGGKLEKFGSPRMSLEDRERQREEEKLAVSPVEHRRGSASPILLQTRIPSPLSREASFEGQSVAEKTPTGTHASFEANMNTPVPSSVLAAASASRKKAEAEDVDRHGRSLGGGNGGRTMRESSVVSMDSNDGLLEPRRSSSPSVNGLEDEMEEVKIG